MLNRLGVTQSVTDRRTDRTDRWTDILIANATLHYVFGQKTAVSTAGIVC